MTGTREPTPPVLALRRPPVRQATTVRSGLTHTFEVFVRELGTWWPVRPFSAGQDEVTAVTVERHATGRVYETWRDGTTVDWGRVSLWQPPGRLAMTWTMPPPWTGAG